MKQKVFCCDFETTTYQGQTHTEVWAAAAVQLHTEDVMIYTNIRDFINHFMVYGSCLLLFHNLKFDGEFILHYLMNNKLFKLAGHASEDGNEFIWKKTKDLEPYEYTYLISSTGSWYNITIKTPHGTITIWDSLKIIPFSVKSIHKAFGTKHEKTSIEYEGYRYAYGQITAEEQEYISNDVLVVKEAVEKMYAEGHDKMTIGSCCMAEFKKTRRYDYKELFPDLTQYKIDAKIYGASNADEYIRKEYGGGWCYVKEDRQGIIQGKGTTYDANSLYPSQMHSQSGNYYPVGLPRFFEGKYNFKIYRHQMEAEDSYYYIRIKCNFMLKTGKLPFMHLRHTLLYNANENLKTNLIMVNGKYSRKYIDMDGNEQETRVELTLSKTDYKLFKEHYNVFDEEILDFCIFHAEKGLFDEYIDFYREKKENAETIGDRTIAKLFSNNLYGKLAASTVSDYKIAYLKDDVMKYHTYRANDKTPGYVAAGAAITSYARNCTIRFAQQNYDIFCYADTDSLHCVGEPDDVKGIPIDAKKYGFWKLEQTWDKAIFCRQKTYIEVSGEHYDVKCAGMNPRCKDLFVASITGDTETLGEMTWAEQEFVSERRGLEDFKVGLKVPGKLMTHRIKGGIVLEPTYFKIR